MDIDVSKENIQPLRGGRNLVQLGTALQAQSDIDAQRQLQIQKEEHEAAIRNYHGTDPLDPWFNYIQWVEQCYPKHGHEGHIDKLVKDCLQLFEKDERYYQDRRLVKLWIKYIDCLANPLEIYQRLHSSGIGVECSEFYRAWACYCEESGDYKRANQVYMLGLQAHAQPLDELEQAHMNFQLYFAQRMLHDDSPTKRKAASALAETRLALTSLKSFKRRNIASVPVQRVGENVRSVMPGVVRQQAVNFDNRLPNSNVMVNVYEDAPSTSHAMVPTAENPGPASLVQACGNVENEREVGIWTNAKIKMVHANVVPHQPLPFVPYEDEEDQLKLSANHVAYCLDDLTFTVPLTVPDPPDSTKIPCYDKAQVYVQDKEYSLEELRSRKYKLIVNKKTEETPAVATQEQNYSNFNEPVAQLSALETLANCALDAEQDHLAQLMPLNIPTLQNITKVTNIHSPGEPKVLVNMDSKELSELAVRRNDENMKPANENHSASSSHGYMPENGATNYGRNHLVEEFNRSLMSNLFGDSVTVNTKEARWELRNLFNDNGSMVVNEPSMVQPIVQQFEVPNFDIHEDRSMTMALHTQKKQVLQEAAEARPVPEKENATKVPMPVATPPTNSNKTAYFEEPSCTQVFNFNIRDASTPNMTQFKKPGNIDQSKIAAVPKYNMDESGVDHVEVGFQKKDENSRPDIRMDQHATVDHQGTGLSVIMEATREFNSKSGSTSSSGQSTRGNFTGYPSTPFSERTQASNYDSMYNQADPTSSKRQSVSNQPRTANGQFARAFAQKRDQPEVKQVQQTPPVPYLSHDHQYQKPTQNFNGYPAQRMHHYQQQQNYSYQQGYSNQMPQQNTVQQGFPSPNPNAYQSPQHPGLQSPHHMQSPHHAPSPGVQPGFQSPTYSNQQIGYHSPGHAMMSPQHAYAGRQEYHYPNQERQHVYAQQQPSPGFQSPPLQGQYQNAQQYFQRPGLAPQQPAQNQSYNQQQNYAMHNQYNNPNMYQQHANSQHANQQQANQQHANQQQANQQHANQQHANQQHANQQHANQQLANQQHPSVPQHPNQSYNMQSPYRPPQKQPDNASYGMANNQQFQIYQSPQPAQNSYRSAPQTPTMPQEKCQPMQTSPDVHAKMDHGNTSQRPMEQNTSNKISPPKHPAPHKSPTAALRSVRHDLPNAKLGQNSPDIGFSNQFLNFISNRNEPKDNANTPKFTNSPTISQKMHKNLYVSSPEQGQVPPSSGLSDSDSKDSMTAQTNTPIQSAKVLQVPDKNKDISKRQLDFEHRAELQSEDSRDSVSKDGRISSVYSRQSDFHSDGYGMDVDSENSMECGPFKSIHSISMVETSDIPRPADIEFPAVIDPFNKKMLTSLLDYVKFPNKTHADGYVEVRSIPKLQVNTMTTIGNSRFSIEKQLGKGNYGAVFLCLDVHNNKSVAVKYQKPSRPWEFYICQEIKARIKDPFMLPGYMDITTAFIGENASLFVSEYSKYGSLLDVANKIRVATTKCINEFIVFLLTSEMLSIVHYLHKAKIIHADIKPDNFLLMKIPAQEWRTPSLQLIDLGCSIDMSLFPEGTTFRELIATEGFTCTEMREGKPWTYQTDLYCLAGTIHVILMGRYMKVVNRLGQWNIDQKLPRYMKVSEWDKIFTTLLNVPDCNNLPDLMDLKNHVDELLIGIDNLSSQLRNFANVLKCR